MANVDLRRAGEPRWIRTGIDDMEVLVVYAGPMEQEKFMQSVVRLGIMRRTAEGPQINPGRERDFFTEYAKRFVRDWKNVKIDGEEKPYDSAIMGQLLAGSDMVMNAVRTAIQAEADFFPESAAGTSS